MIRMKFMESIGSFSVFKQHINSLRLIGILSIIDCLLDKTMFEALEQLPVSSQIKNTLLHKSTLYSTTYQLVLSYEQGDFDTAKKIADEIRLDFNLFTDIYVDAIQWAENVFRNLSS